MTQNLFRIVQISDTHIFSGNDKNLLGVPTQQSFNAVLELIKKDEKKPDIILVTGDLVQDGLESSYKAVSDALRAFKVPAYCVPGNHDNSKMMARIFPRDTVSNHKHIVLKDWHLILLDSHVPNAVEGFLSKSQLDYMQYCLDAYPQHQAMIVFHHHPIPVGSQWLDQLGIRNAEEFWHIVSHYPRVQTVLFGHVHQECSGEKNGIKYYSTPSTCIQFCRQKDDFLLEELNPGYRWIDLLSDGQMQTGIHRIENYIGKFDSEAKGY